MVPSNLSRIVRANVRLNIAIPMLFFVPIQAKVGNGSGRDEGDKLKGQSAESCWTFLLVQEPQGTQGTYRSSKWHYRQRKSIFELIMHFIADTDADENDVGIRFRLQIQTQLFLQP